MPQCSSSSGWALDKNLVIGALSGQVLLMIYSDRTQWADSEYIYGSRSKKSSQGQNNKKLNMPKMEKWENFLPPLRVLYIYIYIYIYLTYLT